MTLTIEQIMNLEIEVGRKKEDGSVNFIVGFPTGEDTGEHNVFTIPHDEAVMYKGVFEDLKNTFLKLNETRLKPNLATTISFPTKDWVPK